MDGMNPSTLHSVPVMVVVVVTMMLEVMMMMMMMMMICGDVCIQYTKAVLDLRG